MLDLVVRDDRLGPHVPADWENHRTSREKWFLQICKMGSSNLGKELKSVHPASARFSPANGGRASWKETGEGGGLATGGDQPALAGVLEDFTSSIAVRWGEDEPFG